MFESKLCCVNIFLLVILSFIKSEVQFIPKELPFQRYRLKSFKCISYNTSITIKYCRLKVTRNRSMLAINMTFYTKWQAPLNLVVSMSYKYGQIYREVVKTPQIEFCGALKNFNNMHPFLKSMLDIFGESIAPLIKGCPFVESLNFVAEPDLSRFPSILPTGMYRVKFMFSSYGIKSVHWESEAEIVSNIKSSFWTLKVTIIKILLQIN